MQSPTSIHIPKHIDTPTSIKTAHTHTQNIHPRNQHTSTCRTAFPRTNSNPGPHPAQPFESARPPDRDLSDEAAKRTGFYLFPFIPSRGLLHTVHRIKRKQVKNERKKKKHYKLRRRNLGRVQMLPYEALLAFRSLFFRHFWSRSP